ncbi:MAG: hypothetical protein K2X82_02535, partial [Gemmataceae bacterium]|nr:hypothetical protein [Gemmataceae bacterium]
MNPSAIDPSFGPQFTPGFVLAAVVVLSILFLLVRDLLFRPRAARPAAPALPAAGPNAVQQVFAGCGLFVLVPVGLLVVAVGLPAWQRRTLAGPPPGPVEYVVLAAVVVGYLAVLRKLFRVLTARTGAAATPAAVPPAPSRFTPRERRFIAFAVPFGLMVVAVAAMLWFAAARSDEDPYGFRRMPGVALVVCGGPMLLAAVLMYRLNKWAYPEWWAHRNRLLYPDAGPKPAVVAAVADVPAPARPCPRCGQFI